MLLRLQDILTASSVLRPLPPNLALRAESMSAVPEGSWNAFPESTGKQHALQLPIYIARLLHRILGVEVLAARMDRVRARHPPDSHGCGRILWRPQSVAE